MEKNKKDDNKSWGLVTCLIIALFITTALCGYFVGAYKFTNNLIKERREANSEVVKEETVEPKTEKETTKEEVKSPFRTCVGTYEGVGRDSVNNVTGEKVKNKIVINLKESGEFEFSNGYDVNGNFVGSKEIGPYVIRDNTLILIHSKHTTGPEELDPSHVTEEHLILKDCSKIKVFIPELDSAGKSVTNSYDLIKK